MIRRIVAGLLVVPAAAGLAVLGLASPAAAHNCGSLTDCLPSGRSLLLALAAVLVVVGLVVLFSAFPPAGGAALALAGGGIAGSAGAISISTAVAGTATVGAGIALAAAADGMPTGGSGGSGSSGRGGDPARSDNARRFREDDFEGTGYSADDLASMTHRHTGSGDMHIGGSAPRPTEAEILNTLRFGRPSNLEGQNAVQYVKDGIRVIVNREMPWQSTSYYIGG